LIRLYAETLELGRITTQEKKEEYYRIIRKESERLTALINNILDFSRI
jgi:signal transduction histidine kinase